MPIDSPFYDKLRPMLEAGKVDWALFTMQDVQYALSALISERKRLRETQKRTMPLSADEVTFMTISGSQIPILFEGQAVKWAERGRSALASKVRQIEERLADPTKFNAYDDILLEKLRFQLERLKKKRDVRT